MTRRLPAMLAGLPVRWRWTVHNLIGRPLSEVLYLAGLRAWSEAAHDLTIPAGGASDPEARG